MSNLEKHLFSRLISKAEQAGYKPTLYKKEKENIIDSTFEEQVVGQDRFYLELCLIQKWLMDEKDIFVQIKPSKDRTYTAYIRDKRTYTEKTQTLTYKQSYPEALYSGVLEVIRYSKI